MFSFMVFFQTCLLFANALAILNERFLNKVGWVMRDGMDYDSFQAKCITLVNARYFFRYPLIILNSIVIIFLMILG
ncbi:hypothetical protein DLAC_00285 [Tieghemostelium lacteum]|uniref:Immediate early response 3-interacting protein 1 n=1 Tax=Tieghemostelium lacteum TaxID=361077 RepID=A0A152A9C3_TIELA|nr:hypothetical protein DLAC_00285 [Tieghemostelium lacteum]|eukprot:KYR02820.1 hypothetical protein DLAC_00285 [Tieghemostelium lacteum]